MAKKSINSKEIGQKPGWRQGSDADDVARVFQPEDVAVRVQSARVRKQPRQARSRQMVEAVLQAAAEVFAQVGYARATTNRMAERAGVSVGSLYQYFPDKDSLLGSLLERHHAEVHEVIDRAISRLADPKTTLEDGLRRLLSDLVAVHRAHPEQTKALSAAVLRQSPLADEIHKDDDDLVQARRVVQLLAERPDVRAGDHRAMALVLGQATAQLVRWLVHDTPHGADQDHLLEEVLQLLVRYLKR